MAKVNGLDKMTYADVSGADYVFRYTMTYYAMDGDTMIEVAPLVRTDFPLR